MAAPAIVRAASLMPVKVMPPTETLEELLHQRINDSYRIMARLMAMRLYGDQAEVAAREWVLESADIEYEFVEQSSGVVIDDKRWIIK